MPSKNPGLRVRVNSEAVRRASLVHPGEPPTPTCANLDLREKPDDVGDSPRWPPLRPVHACSRYRAAVPEPATSTDGRVRRRLTNTQRVLDALCELGAEGQGDLGPRAVAERAGVSLRSLHRFFPNQEQMLLAALRRQVEHSDHLYSIPDAGVGPLEERVAAFVDRRLQLYAVMAPLSFLTAGATPAMPSLLAELRSRRAALESMARAQFAPELQQMVPKIARYAVLSIHVLCQQESLTALLVEQNLAVDDVCWLLADSVHSVLHHGLAIGSSAAETTDPGTS